MKARPERLPVIRTEEDGEELKITVELMRPKWWRFIGAGGTYHRTFALDPYGREVYEMCDGKQTFERIVKQFAKRHHLNLAEAEVSVAAFLKTLMRKGVVAMQVDRRNRT